MRKYLLHILIISFVFLLAPTAQIASYAGELEDAKKAVRFSKSIKDGLPQVRKKERKPT